MGKNNKNNSMNTNLDDYVKLPPITSLPSEEQETVIVIPRTGNKARISTTDSTMKTKLDKMVDGSDMWICEQEDGPVKFYEALDKGLISFRKNKVSREMTDEQKEKAAERLRKAREKK